MNPLALQGAINQDPVVLARPLLGARDLVLRAGLCGGAVFGLRGHDHFR